MTTKPYDLIPSVLKDSQVHYLVTRAVKYGKFPVAGEAWQTDPYTYRYRLDNPKVIYHINSNNNLLLICGTEELSSNIYTSEELKQYGLDQDEILYLIGCDFDDKEYYDKKKSLLNSKTLTWQSPSGNIHMLYWTNFNTKGVRVKKKNIDGTMGGTLIDIQGQDKLLGMPPNEVVDQEYGDILPHKYKPLYDYKPAFIHIEDLETLFCNDKDTCVVGELQPKLTIPKTEYKVTEIRYQIREKVPIRDFLISKGVSRKGSSKNYKCPLHSMKGNGNLTVDFPDRSTRLPSQKAYCHDCKMIGDVVDWRAKIDNISFRDAENLFIKELGLIVPGDRVEIEQPRKGRLDSDFCREVGEVLRDKNTLFFKNDLKKIVELKTNIVGKDVKYESFNIVTPSRFITLLEEHIIPIVYDENPETKERLKKLKKEGKE